MKTLTTILLIAAIGGITPEASAQLWQKQNSGVSTHLWDIAFADSLNGWAVGDSGTIIATKDGGNTWTLQVSHTKRHLGKLSVLDSLCGYIVGDWGVVLKTTDRGATWSTLTAKLWNYSDVHFVNRNVGYIVAGVQLDKPYGTILRTTDGGATWDTTINQNSGVFLGVFFVTPNEGWVVGGKSFFDNFDPAIIVHTTDGGASWTEQPVPIYGPLARVKFLNNKVGCAVGASNSGHSILRTTDGGNVWSQVYVPGLPQGVASISFIDTVTMWVVKRESVHRSQDGGVSWQRIGPDSIGTLGIFFLSRSKGWLVGGYGSVWKYVDLPAGISDPTIKELSFCVEQNYPNPFNPLTTIHYSIQKGGDVDFLIFDLMGKKVREIDLGYHTPGEYSVSISLQKEASGMYVYSMRCNNQIVSKKMILIR